MVDATRRRLLQVGGLAALGLPTTAQAGEEQATDNERPTGDFIHVFYFKFKPEVPEDEIDELMTELAGLKDKIPVLKEFMVGRNTSRHAEQFQYGQVSVFETKEDLEVYEKHPEHRKLVRRIGPKLAGGLAMDFTPI